MEAFGVPVFGKVFVLLTEGDEGNGADTIEFPTSNGGVDVFTIHAVDLGEFVRDNDLEPEEVNEIGKLEPGEEKVFGGGAAPFFILRRLA